MVTGIELFSLGQERLIYGRRITESKNPLNYSGFNMVVVLTGIEPVSKV
jgi:hypothetical protein